MSARGLERSGYDVLGDVVADAERRELIAALPEIESAGTRTLLARPLFRDAVAGFRDHVELGAMVAGLVAVQCTLFRKSLEHNWSVRLHRDRVLPVRGEGPWPAAGVKEGLAHARAPRDFLERCVAVRVHLDGAPEGDLEVVPGSHLTADVADRSRAVAVPVPRGGALVMRPTLQHASAKLEASPRRRVLHYLFAPGELPPGHEWYDPI